MRSVQAGLGNRLTFITPRTHNTLKALEAQQMLTTIPGAVCTEYHRDREISTQIHTTSLLSETGLSAHKYSPGTTNEQTHRGCGIINKHESTGVSTITKG